MRRICFDVACSLYHSFTDGWLDSPADARVFYENQKPFRFYAATAFDDDSLCYRDFIDHDELFDCLIQADEIITFNGKIYDLILLEDLVGVAKAQALWQKPHRDLAGWRGWELKGSIKSVLPDIAESFDAVRIERLAEIANTYSDDSIANQLASTYRDVRFTYSLFERYVASAVVSE